MKKVILSAAFIGISVASFAQKPAAGGKTAEVNFTGSGLNSFSYSTPQLRFRYFNTDKSAFRLLLSAGSTSSTDKQTIDGTEVTKVVSTGFGFTLAPGYEKHFEGTSKLSPYVGGQLSLGLSGGGSTEFTNATGDDGEGFGAGNKSLIKSGSTFSFGLSTYMGADYYITDGVFVGAEFGLNLFSLSSTGEGESSETVGGTTTTAKSGTLSSSNILGVTSGGVRLGFRF
jgi:outer membrane protein W